MAKLLVDTFQSAPPTLDGLVISTGLLPPGRLGAAPGIIFSYLPGWGGGEQLPAPRQIEDTKQVG